MQYRVFREFERLVSCAVILSETNKFTQGDGAHSEICGPKLRNGRFLAPLGMTRCRVIARLLRAGMMHNGQE